MLDPNLISLNTAEVGCGVPYLRPLKPRKHAFPQGGSLAFCVSSRLKAPTTADRLISEFFALWGSAAVDHGDSQIDEIF